LTVGNPKQLQLPPPSWEFHPRAEGKREATKNMHQIAKIEKVFNPLDIEAVSICGLTPRLSVSVRTWCLIVE
jgi:hypothetical protein